MDKVQNSPYVIALLIDKNMTISRLVQKCNAQVEDRTESVKSLPFSTFTREVV